MFTQYIASIYADKQGFSTKASIFTCTDARLL